MEKLLLRISSSVQRYRDMGEELVFDDIQELSTIMKNLSSDLFFLEKHRDDASRKYNQILFANTNSPHNMSVNKAEILANEQCPELYMLRRIMTSGYKCLDSVRSHISALKQEK